MMIPVRSSQVVIGSITSKINEKKLSRIYNLAYKQITNLWKMLPESARTNLKSDEEETVKTEDMKSLNIETGDLQEKVNSLKGKQLTYKEKLAKKKLKNKLNKKKKSKEVQLLKAEARQKKKELKEQKWAEKMKNSGQEKKNPLEQRITQVLDGNTYSDEDEEMEEEIGEISPKHPSSPVKQPKLKKKSKNKASVEEIAQEEEPEEIKNEVKSQADGLSSKKLKLTAKKVEQNAKKREKKKLFKKKIREEALVKAQELLANKKLHEPEQQKEKETEVMYNKIDFETESPNKKFKKKKPKTEKDPVKALNKIEELNKKLTELKESGNEEKAAEIKSKESWKKAILKADGVKVKDNVRLIKKTIKRNENKKSKSKTEWAQRKETVDKRISNAQKKRKDNIMKKKKERKQKKIKKSIKKGRVVI